MKKIGMILMTIGGIWVLVAFNMDTTISSGGLRVHNIGLMDERQTQLIVFGLLVIVGVILFAVSNTKQAQSGQLNVGSDKKSFISTPKSTTLCYLCNWKVNAGSICESCGKHVCPSHSNFVSGKRHCNACLKK